MSLAGFQKALADLVASPEACSEVLVVPQVLLARYELTTEEYERLVAMVRHPGMRANCLLYRANRLTPIAVHYPITCELLGSSLRDVVERFWARRDARSFSNFLIEADWFGEFVLEEPLDASTRQAANTERNAVIRAIADLLAPYEQ